MSWFFPSWGGRGAPDHVRIRRGLDIELQGAPRQSEARAVEIHQVGLMAADYRGLRPAHKVSVGDRVRAGDLLFTDRRKPDVGYTAPVAGTVAEIATRGSAGAFQALRIVREGDDQRVFDRPKGTPDRETARTLLLESGLWPAFRARPFDTVPDPATLPDAIFVTAMASDPLAADAGPIVEAHDSEFAAGLDMLAQLTDGPVYVCQGPGPRLAPGAVIFEGPHPAGLAGTHIHRLLPVGGGRVAWHIGYQDVIAIGHLMAEGALWMVRIVALAGPGAAEPRLVRVPLGADLIDLTAGELAGGDQRVISGSVLSGSKTSYLGRYHLQVTVVPEGWNAPNEPLLSERTSTALSGAAGPLVPIAAFDRVMALDIPAVPLLRAISVGDREAATRLGCLELVEEDVALLSYVCPGRGDYGPLLRAVLNEIEAER
ncbi:MAG TPA: NADH:ubiquinone reductase (Na(+)-transporting) subunit A [Alphaproteobacteria bacterium]|nr:NADH:ubiquinone reductase (Na(+)-transporting) subunit A [Alphaproteobacteria bacterium]